MGSDITFIDANKSSFDKSQMERKKYNLTPSEEQSEKDKYQISKNQIH